jgi:hypothetical protein
VCTLSHSCDHWCRANVQYVSPWSFGAELRLCPPVVWLRAWLVRTTDYEIDAIRFYNTPGYYDPTDPRLGLSSASRPYVPSRVKPVTQNVS